MGSIPITRSMRLRQGYGGMSSRDRPTTSSVLEADAPPKLQRRRAGAMTYVCLLQSVSEPDRYYVGLTDEPGVRRVPLVRYAFTVFHRIDAA